MQREQRQPQMSTGYISGLNLASFSENDILGKISNRCFTRQGLRPSLCAELRCRFTIFVMLLTGLPWVVIGHSPPSACRRLLTRAERSIRIDRTGEQHQHLEYNKRPERRRYERQHHIRSDSAEEEQEERKAAGETTVLSRRNLLPSWLPQHDGRSPGV